MLVHCGAGISRVFNSLSSLLLWWLLTIWKNTMQCLLMLSSTFVKSEATYAQTSALKCNSKNINKNYLWKVTKIWNIYKKRSYALTVRSNAWRQSRWTSPLMLPPPITEWEALTPRPLEIILQLSWGKLLIQVTNA